jgi:hypothetical protein
LLSMSSARVWALWQVLVRCCTFGGFGAGEDLLLGRWMFDSDFILFDVQSSNSFRTHDLIRFQSAKACVRTWLCKAWYYQPSQS